MTTTRFVLTSLVALIFVGSCGKDQGAPSTTTCPAGQQNCDGCVDTTQNVAHCGACGVACVSGQSCSEGNCQCLPGLSPCPSGCADLNTSGANCGACGTACPAGQVCSAGVCGTSCAVGVACGADCVDTASNPFHCGGCSQACAAGQSCQASQCGCTTSGQIDCSGTCVDPLTDANHCGDCGNACGAGRVCSSGECTDNAMGTSTGTGGTASTTTSTTGAGGTNSNATGTTMGTVTSTTGAATSTAGGAGGAASTSATTNSTSSGGTGGSPTALADCRGLVALRAGSGNYVGWRLKATDQADLAFNVYRDGELLTETPLADSTNLLDGGAPVAATYQVRPVIAGVEQGESEVVTASPNPYLAIPIDNGTNQAGRLAGVADLDGDCRFDFVLKRSDGDRDVTQEDSNPEETIKLEAYNGNGQFMWRRDVGPNVRPGVWFSPFIVFDLDGDGKAEVALKSSEIPTELGGEGDLNGDGQTDYRETNGDVYANEHPDIEFLEIWNGETGATLARAPWIDVGPWGSDGNRYNRNMMSPAYLDGQQASVVITRGGNSRDEVHAYDYRNGELTLRWQWVVSNGGGNYGHNVRAGDIDGDGRDEFLFFNVAIDDDGQSVLWNTEEAHGDRFHMTDIDPDRPGMEVFYIQEFADTYVHPISLRDAATGELVWGPTGDWGDVGRGLCANIDANSRGVECWAVGESELYDAQGQSLGPRPNTPNMAIFWDADRERELISGTTISKWNGSSLNNVHSASGCSVGTRDIPMGYGDILGDWREEAWWLCDGDSELRVYVNTEVTDTRLYTLMQDPEYRIGIGEMSQGYVQAPHPSFYIGSDMNPPPTPRLAIPAGT